MPVVQCRYVFVARIASLLPLKRVRRRANACGYRGRCDLRARVPTIPASVPRGLEVSALAVTGP